MADRLDTLIDELRQDDPLFDHTVRVMQLLTGEIAKRKEIRLEITCACGGTALYNAADGLHHCQDCQAIWQDD